ncbi:MAG: PEP/pyruvate-binding domain-containing protein, partial [Candidatus Hodarchaeota archaeon]
METKRSQELVLWFDELTKKDIQIAGGKNASLGEMRQAKIPIPPGFAVTAQAYQQFLAEAGIAAKVYKLIEETVTNQDDPKLYEHASKNIRKLIEAAEIPHDIQKAIKKAYDKLNESMSSVDIPVAVRSSATAEDLPDASFAGQQETYLNVKGAEELLKKTRKCWSSLFTPRAIFYRTKKGFKHEQVLISVGVQKMVNARSAGVMFTINPVTGDSSQLVIEGTWGLGEAVVSGAETPDHYVVDKNTLEIKKRRIVNKPVEIIGNPNTGKTEQLKVPAERQDEPCITDDEINHLAKLGNQIHEHYGNPQDIEW